MKPRGGRRRRLRVQAVCCRCGLVTAKRPFWRVHRLEDGSACHNGRWFGVWIPVPALAKVSAQGLLTVWAEASRSLWGLKNRKKEGRNAGRKTRPKRQ